MDWLNLEVGIFFRPFDWQLDAVACPHNWYLIVGPIELFICFVER